MSRKKYYCLVAGLPDLFFSENKLVISSLDFRNELKTQLSKTDYDLVKLLYLHHDNKNLLNLIFKLNEPFNIQGNFSSEMLDNPLSYPSEIPDYIILFSEWVKMLETLELNLQIKNQLQNFYYEYVLKTSNEFLKNWLIFQLNVKNILTTFNCVHFEYSLDNQLIHGNQENSVYSLLLNKRLKPELFEEDLPFADQIFRIAESNSNAEEKEKAIDKIMWMYLDEYTFFHHFTIEKILGFVIKLTIVERWIKLDIQTGKELLNRLIEELKLSCTFPEEFSTVK